MATQPVGVQVKCDNTWSPGQALKRSGDGAVLHVLFDHQASPVEVVLSDNIVLQAGQIVW